MTTADTQQAANLQRIVVGVDGSPASLEALRWAVAEARAHGGGDVRAVPRDQTGTPQRWATSRL